jgi:hypothetical protein
MPRQTLYLHIGYHKTGTSAVQAFMASNAQLLATRGILYPNVGRAGNSHALLAISLKKTNISLDAERLYAELAEESARSNAGKVVISSENFMENIPPETVAAQVAKTGLAARVVVYLRRQDLWLQSLYNEVVRDPSRRYTGSIGNMREVRQGIADYFKVISHWAESFGQENLIVRVLEQEQLPKGLYWDFVNAIGADYHHDYWTPDDSVNLNVGFSDVLILALRRLNQIAMTRDMYIRMIAAFAEMARHPAYVKEGEYELLSSVEANSILNKFSAGNEQIANQYLKRPSGILFYSAPPPHEKRRAQLSADIERDIFARLPEDIRMHCIKMRPRLSRDDGSAKVFLPPDPKSEIIRLRTENQRLRQELNWLYDERGCPR